MLDLHLGQSKDNAAQTIPRFQLGESDHTKVFTRPAFDKSRFPKLSKIEDYYADASFISEELPELIKEIDKTINRFSGDVAVIKALQLFRSTCEEAIRTDETLFCIAD